MTIPFDQRSFPDLYEHELVGPLFRPFARLTLDEVAPKAGDRVLDVACGTGIVARLAKERVGPSGTVVGVDLSAPMLAVAAMIAPEIDWREGNAQALPLKAGEQFDVVVCQQGLQFFPDRPQGVREMRRALAPGGRVAVSTWRPDEELPVQLELRRIAERHLGPVADRRHGFGEPGPLEALLREAGFDSVRSKIVSHTVRFSDGMVFVRLNATALVGMSQAGKDLTGARRAELIEAVSRDSSELVRAHTDETGFAYELRAVVATGARVAS
jgi:ubiquinone/menaquinone biosynthesis C-methylase UbiE